MTNNLKATNVIYTGYQEYTFHMARHLKNIFNYQPVCWTHSLEIEPLIKAEFKDLILHNFYDSIKGIPAKEMDETQLETIDEKMLSGLAYYESIAMNLMNRMDLTLSFSFNERRDHYQHLLKYWKTVITQLKPEIIFFEEVPHAINTFVLYILAKHYGLKTYIFERTAFFKLIYLLEDYETGHDYIIKYYEKFLKTSQLSTIKLEDPHEKKMLQLRGGYNEGRPYYTKYEQSMIGNMITRPNLFETFKKAVRVFRYFNPYKLKSRYEICVNLFKAEPFNYMKAKNKPIRGSNIKRWEMIYFRWKITKQKKQLLTYYNALSDHALNLDQPFVFCALHSQPERATCPSGGVYVNQLLMIDLLIAALPEGWHLYVKDHIGQFFKNGHSELYRSTEFYDYIKCNPRIKIIPLEYESFTLIDKAKAVVTVTGTIGWESLVRGTPVLYFGLPWFVGCRGAFQVNTLEKLTKAMQQIKDGFKVDYMEVKAYVKCIENLGGEGAVGGTTYCKLVGYEPEENGLLHFNLYKKHLDFKCNY